MTGVPSAMNQIEKIVSRSAEVGGGVSVHRVLPSRQRRMIGAWCFLDHAGPATFEAGQGMRVGPHPHTGLQTFTWMIEGQILHRDSLGFEQVIRPGEVNLMTAGRGIAHAEESLPGEARLHAAQLWIALPKTLSGIDPAFEHYPDLPTWQQDGCDLTLLAGRLSEHQAPTRLHSDLLGVDFLAKQDTRLSLTLRPDFEYGILPLEGKVVVGTESFGPDELAYLGSDRAQLDLSLAAGTRALLLGGTPFDGEIVMWWNFVGHSRAEVIQAQRDWEAGHARFGQVKNFDGPPLVAPPLPWKPA